MFFFSSTVDCVLLPSVLQECVSSLTNPLIVLPDIDLYRLNMPNGCVAPGCVIGQPNKKRPPDVSTHK
ncbi:DNA transposase THAP9like, partial [Caligus rogercresseyi]